jgi:putative transposase
MKKIQPSERINKELEEIFKGINIEDNPGLLNIFLRKSMQKTLQEALEQEVTDYLGRGYYKRNEERRPGYRNGYEARNVKTGEGKLPIEVPQVRESETPYHSRIIDQLGLISPELERLALEMYTRGLSTRDIEETFRDKSGERLLSKDAVSKISEGLWEEYEKFTQRDLSEYDVIYLFVDAVYESLRKQAGISEAILCAWGILSSGHKIMLHLELGNKESYDSWNQFFRGMTQRGLRQPLLVISDGAPGLIKAVDESFHKTKRQRCLAHKLRNIAAKLPERAIEEVLGKIKNCLYQTDPEIARLIAVKIIEEYSEKYPSAIKCFQEDFEQCIAYMEFPEGHHRYIRTTNLLERSFQEEKRRTKVIPRFFDERSCLKLVFGVLIRVSEKWQRIRMNDYDLTLLKKIRDLYGWNDNKKGFLSNDLAA